jgi:hypothetical protein
MDRLSRLCRMDGAVGSNVMSYEQFSPIIDHACAQIGSGLRALCLFGSCLQPGSPATGGIPDLLAILDDGSLEPLLRRLHYGVLTRFLATGLPPLTLALRDPEGQRIVAKLNLIEISAATDQLTRLPDLYLAGRMSKKTVIMYARDPACRLEFEELSLQAARQIAALAVRELPVRTPLVDVVRACIALSYRAEVRPEGPTKMKALYASFAAFYDQRFMPLLVTEATARNIRHDEKEELLLDERSEHLRSQDRHQVAGQLRISRLRTLLRWPKQMIVYDGWISYALSKRGRARQLEAGRRKSSPRRTEE